MDIKYLTGASIRTESSSSPTKPRGSVVESSQTTPRKSAVNDEPVTLTQTAKTLSAARGSANEPPFDSAKVAEIKAALTEGRYVIDNQRLASSMLDFEGQLAAE